MALMMAVFSAGHTVHYTGNKMHWAWQVHRPEGIDWSGAERATMITGFSGTRDNANNGALKLARYEFGARIEIRQLEPHKETGQ